MGRGTAEYWVTYLERFSTVPLTDEWEDPEFVQEVSHLMMMFMWRSLHLRLVRAGYAEELKIYDKNASIF